LNFKINFMPFHLIISKKYNNNHDVQFKNSTKLEAVLGGNQASRRPTWGPRGHLHLDILKNAHSNSDSNSLNLNYHLGKSQMLNRMRLFFPPRSNPTATNWYELEMPTIIRATYLIIEMERLWGTQTARIYILPQLSKAHQTVTI
jgi:hypothetical protein